MAARQVHPIMDNQPIPKLRMDKVKAKKTKLKNQPRFRDGIGEQNPKCWPHVLDAQKEPGLVFYKTKNLLYFSSYLIISIVSYR